MVEKIEINLIPNEYRVYRRKITVPKDILVSLVVSFVMILLTLLFLSWKMNEFVSLQEEVVDLTEKINSEKTVETKIKKLKSERAEALAMLNGLSSIPLDEGDWINLMEAYCRELPGNTWLSEVSGEKVLPVDSDTDSDNENSEQENGVSDQDSAGTDIRVVVKGSTESFGEVGQYMSRLKGIPEIDNVTVVEVNSYGDNEGFTFEFTHTYAVKTGVADSPVPVQE
ncbi:MAG: hypothetical protein ACQEQV_05300 [Fibrobacterota bacterium]